MFGILDCSDINNNKTKIIGIGGGVLVAGGLGYLYMKPIVAKIIANSQTELLTTLRTNNSNIYLTYDSICKNRDISTDIAVNNFISDYSSVDTLLRHDKNFFNSTLINPLIPYKKELKEFCEFEINGVLRTPALLYSVDKIKTMEVIYLQEDILNRLEGYKNKYTRLSKRLDEIKEVYFLTSKERLELTELIVDGSGINSLFNKYIKILSIIGNDTLSNAFGIEVSVEVVFQKHKMINQNSSLFLINDLKVNQDVIAYETLFFSDNPFFYDIVLILGYCIFSIVSLYTYGGNPIPKGYVISSCNRLFCFKKYKINKYEDHPEGDDGFWRISRWVDY
jgi:hypothetical protein